MKQLLYLLLLASPLLALCQKGTAGTDAMRFNDGKTLPGKQRTLSYCEKAISALQYPADTSIDVKKVCNCMLQSAELMYSSVEYNKQQGLYANLYDMVADEKSPAHLEAVNCMAKGKLLADHMPVTGSYDYNSREVHSAYTTNCIQQLVANGDAERLNADVYCECIWEGMRANNVTPGNFVLLTDANSDLYNKVAAPCIDKAGKGAQAAKASVSGPESQRVQLAKMMGANRIKVNVSGLEKYMILNTGMPETYISSSLENELLLNGSIKHSDYLPMLNGHRKVLLHNIKIEGYTIDNVEAVISDDYNGWMYLGGNVLNAFSQWCMDNRTNELILQK